MNKSAALARKLHPLLVLWAALTPRRRRQVLGLQLLSLLAAAGEVANLGALLPFLRLLANPQEGIKALGPLAVPLRNLPEQHLLLTLGLAFMVVVVFSTLLRVVTIRSQLRLGALITADLGQQVFSDVLRRPFAWHLSQNSSMVLGHLTKDVDQVSGSIQALLVLVVNLAIVALLGASLIALSPAVMPVLGVMLAGFYVVVFRFTRGNLRADGQRFTINYQSSLQVVQEALGGIRDVLLDRTQPFFEKAYASSNLISRLAVAAINTKALAPRYLIEGFSVLVIVGLSLGLALSGQGIERQFPLLGTLALASYRLLQPLQQCFNAFSSMQANQASLIRLEPFLLPTAQPVGSVYDLVGVNQFSEIRTMVSLIEFQHIRFRYSAEDPWVIHDMNLVINSGERVAFVGSSGSGKSTCTDLILGLLMPTEGVLLIQGQNLHSCPGSLDAWQARVSHVPQQIYLSDATFAGNIAFGIPLEQIDQQLVRKAAQQARISDLIESSPMGYDTVVGERGIRLSGGQRQRIGIARALYKKSQVLVLDEATSALDIHTEAEVMSAIESLDRAITVIIVAHRLSTVKLCDRIFLLEEGQISGVGSFRELSSSNSKFRSFVNLSNSLHNSLF